MAYYYSYINTKHEILTRIGNRLCFDVLAAFLIGVFFITFGFIFLMFLNNLVGATEEDRVLFWFVMEIIAWLYVAFRVIETIYMIHVLRKGKRYGLFNMKVIKN